MINILYLFNIFECGHYCIKYILRKDKIKLNLNYHRQFMNLNLVCKVLRHYYLKVECYRVNNVKNLLGTKRVLTLIQIAKKYNHYIVVEKIKNNKIYYYDPLFIGVRKMKLDKFEKVWVKCCCFIGKK